MSEGERLTELAKRRGFYFPSSSAYGGAAGFWTYGPQGAALKSNIEDAWRDRYVVKEGHQEISAPDVMPEPVFEASGHLDGFDDMIVECGECGATHRADHLVEDNTDIEEAESLPNEEVMDLIAEHGIECPSCHTSLADQPVDNFNLMFETNIGPGSSSPGYLRPETAQGIFVEFPQLSEYARNQLPFGVAQIGKAYRNEISPRKSLVRVREFTQAELEHFVDPEEDEPPLAEVEDVVLPLYSAAAQESEDGGQRELTVREAVDEASSRASGSPTIWASPESGTSALASTWTAFATVSTSPASAPTTPPTAGTPRARSTATGSRSRASPTGATTTSRNTPSTPARTTQCSSSTTSRLPSSARPSIPT